MAQVSAAVSSVRYDIVQFPGGKYGLLKPTQKAEGRRKSADIIGYVHYAPDPARRVVYVSPRITSTSTGDPAEDERAIHMVLKKARQFFPKLAIITR